jgi:membrane-bound lytic murein transglycosylase A
MSLTERRFPGLRLASLGTIAVTLLLGASPVSAPLMLTSVAQLTTAECPISCIGVDDQLWGHPKHQQTADRYALVKAIDHSLRYLNTPEAVKAYQNYPIADITRERVQASLKRFRQLLVSSRSPQALQKAVHREFAFYQSVGKDGRGTVAYTGYFQPVFMASPVRTSTYRYPLYSLPSDFKQWPTPHPTRQELEGIDGLQGSQGKLKGLELFWLRDRLQAFLVHVQGSAQLRLTTGKRVSVGYAGRTQYPYTSIGKELVKAGKLRPEGLTLQNVIDYFTKHPTDLNQYLPRNQSFVFFKPMPNKPPLGSIRVPVTPERSIATDKSLMPPGALALVQTRKPFKDKNGQVVFQPVNRFALDQDTGSAIIGPGRVDIYMGTGPQAGDRAGLINYTGRLYYLMLK